MSNCRVPDRRTGAVVLLVPASEGIGLAPAIRRLMWSSDGVVKRYQVVSPHYVGRRSIGLTLSSLDGLGLRYQQVALETLERMQAAEALALKLHIVASGAASPSAFRLVVFGSARNPSHSGNFALTKAIVREARELATELYPLAMSLKAEFGDRCRGIDFLSGGNEEDTPMGALPSAIRKLRDSDDGGLGFEDVGLSIAIALNMLRDLETPDGFDALRSFNLFNSRITDFVHQGHMIIDLPGGIGTWNEEAYISQYLQMLVKLLPRWLDKERSEKSEGFAHRNNGYLLVPDHRVITREDQIFPKRFIYDPGFGKGGAQSGFSKAMIAMFDGMVEDGTISEEERENPLICPPVIRSRRDLLSTFEATFRAFMRLREEIPPYSAYTDEELLLIREHTSRESLLKELRRRGLVEIH